jgi:multidrug efflux system membrane fusion protein
MAAPGALTGCERGNGKIAAAEMPVVPVSSPVEGEVTDYVFYTGRTNAVHSVIIQPRVTGFLVAAPFEEGKEVAEGELLFEIDPSPYKAQLAAATAQVKQSEASLGYAEATNARFKALAEKSPEAVGARELDQYKAQEAQAKANLDFAKANLESATLNLKWTKIYSPIAGRISRYYLTPGNLVNQDVTQMTTVVSMDRMHVYFDMDEPTLLRINRAINEGKLKSAGTGHSMPRFAASLVGTMGTPLGRRDTSFGAALKQVDVGPTAFVELGLAGEEGYPHKGVINFWDNQVNPGTGSISVRGVVENPRPPGGRHLLVPGMFVRVRLPIGEPKDELLVIDRAVTSDQGLKYVYVLDDKNKVVARRVTLGSLQDDGLRVIAQGLKKEDRVLIGGLQQVRPGMLVQPESVTMPTLANPALPKEKTKGKKSAKK